MTSTCCLFWRADFMRRPWPQFQLLKTAWLFRAAFGGAIGEGLSVHEMKPRDDKSAVEASFLYGEIFV